MAGKRCDHHLALRQWLRLFIEQLLDGEVDVAAWGHQLDAITDQELVLHCHFGQTIFALTGKFTDKLLTIETE